MTRHGLWLAVGDAEFFLDHKHFPWFRNATIDAVCNVKEVTAGHFFWPALDIDLDLDTIREPVKYPLVYKP